MAKAKSWAMIAGKSAAVIALVLLLLSVFVFWEEVDSMLFGSPTLTFNVPEGIEGPLFIVMPQVVLSEGNEHLRMKGRHLEITLEGRKTVLEEAYPDRWRITYAKIGDAPRFEIMHSALLKDDIASVMFADTTLSVADHVDQEVVILFVGDPNELYDYQDLPFYYLDEYVAYFDEKYAEED